MMKKIMLWLVFGLAAMMVQAEETPSLEVTTLTDVMDANDGLISLREAISYSAINPSLGSNITFNASLSGGTNVLALGQLEISHNVTITGPGADLFTINANQSGRIFHISGNDVVCEITGLTIMGGEAAGHGGGIFFESKALSLTDVVIRENSVIMMSGYRLSSCGGGIYCNSGTLTLTDVIVVENSVYAGGSFPTCKGGGIYSKSEAFILTNVEVCSNTLYTTGQQPTTARGGGVFCGTGTMTLHNVKVEGNLLSASERDCGGIYAGCDWVSLNDVEVVGNESSGVCIQGDGEIMHSIINNNVSYGLHVKSLGTVLVTNVEVGENGKDGVRIEGSASLVNTTIAGNASRGVYVHSSGTVSLANTIVALNKNEGIFAHSDALVSLTNTLAGSNGGEGSFIGPFSGISNFVGFVGSLFLDAENGDYHLIESSHAINRGNNSLVVNSNGNPLPVDLANQPRIVDGCVDIGAYEFQGSTSPRETATGIVTTLQDVMDATDGMISLREAIVYASMDDSIGKVLFDESLDGGTITLAGFQIGIYESCVIDASALASLTIDAGQQSRVFYIDGNNVNVIFLGLTVKNGRFFGHGGGIYNSSSSLEMKDVKIVGGQAKGKGGGIFNDSGDLTLTGVKVLDNMVAGVRWTSNRHAQGGGVYNASGSLMLTDVDIEGNSAYSQDYYDGAYGGGLFNGSGSVTLTNVKIESNSVIASSIALGGGIYNSGMLTLANTEIVGNAGHGLYTGGTATLTDVTIAENSSQGVYVKGVATLQSTTIASNSSYGVYVHAGGLAKLINTVVHENSSHGVYVRGVAELTHVTISANRSSGVYVHPDGDFMSANTIMALNEDEGLLVQPEGVSTLINSMVVLNGGAGEIVGHFAGSNNIIGGIDPLFVDVEAGNLRLKAGSYAVNYGSDALSVDASGDPLLTDKAGQPRNSGDGVDIGAYEYQGNPVREIPSEVVTTLLDVDDVTDGLISLREAVFFVANEELVDTVYFDESLSGGTIYLDGHEIQLLTSCTIDASALDLLTVDASEQSRVFYVDGENTDVNLSGLTIVGGKSSDQGGGIYNGSSRLSLSNIVIRENSSSSYGGGIFNNSGVVSLVDVEVNANSASSRGGGMYNASGMIFLEDSVFLTNSSHYGGGLYCYEGIVSSTNVLVRGNSVFASAYSGATSRGGGIYNHNGTLMFTGAGVFDNTTSASGSRTSCYGGGIYNCSGGTVILNDVQVHGNYAPHNGGGIYNDSMGLLTLENVTVSENSSGSGGGVYNKSGLLTWFDGELRGNVAGNGGGIYNDSDNLSLTNVQIIGNSCRGLGGGVYNNSGAVLLADLEVKGNVASHGGPYGLSLHGGGVYNNSGSLTLSGVSVFENSCSTYSYGSSSRGGGVYNRSGSLTLLNSLLAGNSVSVLPNRSSSASGGGIYTHSGALKLTHTTISGNSLEGVFVASEGEAALENTIVAWSETAGVYVHSNATVTLTNTMVDVVDGSFVGRGNIEGGLSPLFVDAEGGDFHLMEGSHAINQGDDALSLDLDGSPLLTDMSNLPRISGDRVDIGAYEYQGNPLREIPSGVVTTLLDVDDVTDGLISLREALFFVVNEDMVDAVVFDEVLDNGTIVLGGHPIRIADSVVIDASALMKLTVDASQKSRVFYVSGRETEVSIRGLNVTGGKDHSGGGVYVDSSALVLIDVVVHGNSALVYGGGLYNRAGNVIMTGVNVEGNSGGNGGGIYNASGTLSMTNVDVRGNSGSNGGGVYNTSGTLVLTDVSICENSISGMFCYGGGIYNSAGSLTLVDAEISQNTSTAFGSTSYGASSYGGGVYQHSGVLKMRSSDITKNSIFSSRYKASSYGGGIYYNSGELILKEVKIRGNTISASGAHASTRGGGIFCNSYEFYMANSQVSHNIGGGIYVNATGDIEVVNSTVCQNSLNGVSVHSTGKMMLANTIVALNGDVDIEGSPSGCNNLIGVEPQFVDVEDGNYHLTKESPAINTGNNEFAVDAYGVPLRYDLAGNVRVLGATVDVGAYEYSGDTDSDGLPDEWESQFPGGDLDPTALCANGINTVREAYIAGLDPTNATSRLMLNPVSGNALHWSAISGRVYSIWWTTNLLENFQPLETNLLWPQGGYTNLNPNPCDYYKIKVELE